MNVKLSINLLLIFAPFCRVAAQTNESPDYKTIFRNQISKGIAGKLSLNKTEQFTSYGDTVAAVPYKSGPSFLLHEIKTRKIVFVEFEYDKKDNSGNSLLFKNNTIRIYNRQRDTVKTIILGSSGYCSIVDVTVNKKSIAFLLFDSSILNKQSYAEMITPVVSKIPDTIYFNQDSGKVAMSKINHIVFNIDWFLHYNRIFPEYKKQNTSWIMRLICFTKYKNELIEYEFTGN